MFTQLIVTLVGAGLVVLVVVVGSRSLAQLGGKPLPVLPAEGGRISAVELKSIKKGASAHFGAGDRQSGGFVELTPERLRSGSLLVFDVDYAEIESVHVQPFGLTRIVVFELTGDRKSLAATLRRAGVPRVLAYLSSTSVPVRGPGDR